MSSCCTVRVNITAFVASFGVGGVAIALATQNILGDLFSSLAIVLDKPFVIGDFIVVGELKGPVEKVGRLFSRLRGGVFRALCGLQPVRGHPAADHSVSSRAV